MNLRDVFLTEIENNFVVGENGMFNLESTGNNNLNFFAAAGGLRNDTSTALMLFKKAYTEDPILGIANLLNSRDPRNGMGERDIFIRAADFLAAAHNEVFHRLILSFGSFARWKDLFKVVALGNTNKKNKEFIALCIVESINESNKVNGTLAYLPKYIPLKSKNREVREVISLARKLAKLSPADFRRAVVKARSHVVETKITQNDFSEIDYSSVPSLAMNRYSSLFLKKDYENFSKFINDVNNGKAKINAGVLTPENVVHRVRTFGRPSVDLAEIESELNALDAMWKNLTDFVKGSEVNILPVVDVSGSMISYGVLDASVGLGIYLSERNRGALQNIICSFSDSPRLFEIDGTIAEKVSSVLDSENIGYSTDYEKTLELIAKKIKESNVPKEEMPVILFLSDMNFNTATSSHLRISDMNSNTEKSPALPMDNFAKTLANKIFNKYDLDTPKIVYWNLNHNGGFQVKASDDGFAQVSGRSASVMKTVLENIDCFNPKNIMLEAIEKYAGAAHYIVNGND